MTAILSPSIIMRTWEYGETDLIVSFFTEDQGWLKGIAKGRQKKPKPFCQLPGHVLPLQPGI